MEESSPGDELFATISSKADQGNNAPVRALLVRLETVADIGNTSTQSSLQVDRIQR